MLSSYYREKFTKCQEMVINYRKLNPNGFHLLRCLNDDNIRFVILNGGSSSGKSYSVAQTILIQTLLDGENTLVLRKVGASIKNTIYEDFRVAARGLGVDNLFKFQQNTIKCAYNGAKIDFGGLDDPEKIKGISNYKRVCLEELTEFDEVDFKQIRKRLRGKRGQKVIATFNPISEGHWIKKKFIDLDKWHDVPMRMSLGGDELPEELTKVKSIKMNEPRSVMNPRTREIETHAPDTILLQSTYLNNFWVVGSPDGKYGFYDEQCVADFEKDRLNDPDYYNVYALGEWGIIRTGSEFFGSFNRGKHTHEHIYDESLPIHISVDNNVLPYISVSYWQADLTDGIALRQIDETAAESPNNTVKKSAALVARTLHEKYEYSGKVYLHGDASTRAANTIDEEKRSFLDLFISSLQSHGIEVVDMVGNKNPSVAMSGEFINAVLEQAIPGVSISIDEDCHTSIEDYMAVQKDANGAILKTKVKNKTTMQTYEEHGHLSDTFRYVVCDICKEEFTLFSNRRKRNLYARGGLIHFYNPGNQYEYSNRIVYAMPNYNGKFILLYGCQCGPKWHIVDIEYKDAVSVSEVREAILSHEGLCVLECADAYFPFVSELRENTDREIRVAREFADMDRRIAATSDYVKEYVCFSEEKLNDSVEYSSFISALLDYHKDSESKEASATLSGFIQYAIKLGSN